MDLMTVSISKLSAMYNEAWRKHHNEIEPEKMKAIMTAIETVANKRFFLITGKGGSWEFKPLFEQLPPLQTNEKD